MRHLWVTGIIFVLLFAGCGWDGTPTRSNDFTPLTSIAITAETTTIANHTSTRLTATGNYSGLFSRDITGQVAWSSAAPAVADFVTAAVPNQVTGITAGSVELKATLGTVSSPPCSITVTPETVTGLTIEPKNAELSKGSSRQFSVSGTLSDGSSQNLNYDVDWLSSAPAVATIGTDPGNKGVAQGVSEGVTTISATFAFNGVNDATLLTVTAPQLQSITVLPANPTMVSLSQAAFTAVGTYSDNTTANITGQVVWSSTSSDIATVSTAGAVKTLVTGTTSIQAKLTGVTGATSLKVTGGNLTGINISPLNPRLVAATTVQLTATGTFSNGSSRDISGAVDWTVANTDFATIATPGGNLAWLNPLAATSGTKVTAKSGSVSADTTLTVIEPQLRDISIAPVNPEQTAGTSTQLSVTAFFSDGSSQDVTLSSDWSSDADTIATVGNSGINKGRVSAVANGSAIISASYGAMTKKTTLTVKTRTLRELAISGTTSAVAGNQLSLTATATYSDGTVKDVTDKTAWSIDKTGIVTLADPVNQPGQIVMIDAGTATLTASFGSISKTVTLTAKGF